MKPPDHGPFVWIHGHILPAGQAVVSVFDRGFLYGDSLFESIHVRHGRPFRRDAHWRRLKAGAHFLRIPSPTDVEIGGAVDAVLNANHAERGTLRITLSRGEGRRGYSPKDSGPPTLAVTWHASPPLPVRRPWRLATSPYRVVADDPVAAFKHGSRLSNVLARASAEEAGADEALLLDSLDRVVETASGNIFCLRGSSVLTPPVSGLLPGISRDAVMELAPRLGLAVVERSLAKTDLLEADAVFMTASSLGVVPVISLDGRPTGDPGLCSRMADALDDLVEHECAGGTSA